MNYEKVFAFYIVVEEGGGGYDFNPQVGSCWNCYSIVKNILCYYVFEVLPITQINKIIYQICFSSFYVLVLKHALVWTLISTI